MSSMNSGGPELWWWILCFNLTRLRDACMCMCACSVAQLRLTLGDPMDCNPPGLCTWNFSDKNTGRSHHFLFQGIFPTQGSTHVPCGSCSWQEDSLGCLKVKVKVALLCPTLCDPMDWNFPGQNTEVGSLSLLRGSSQLRDQNQGVSRKD